MPPPGSDRPAFGDRGGFDDEQPKLFGSEAQTTNFDPSAYPAQDRAAPAFSAPERSAPKPHILAPQANEWASEGQEMEVTKGRRTGLVLLFLLAMLLVALIALVLAAWSVFRSGDPLPETSTETETGTEAPADGVEGQPVDDATTLPPATTLDPTLLQYTLLEEPFICDSTTRPFAQLAGGAPNEEVTFTSPQTENLKSGMADATGNLDIRWSCDPEQAPTTWELTAAGVTSGKSVTFVFAGAVAAAPAAGEDPVGTPADTAGLTVQLVEEPFKCDGNPRIFGGISGADAGEQVAFTSPQASGSIQNGTANEDGNLDVRWICDPTQAGTVWEITATGVGSGKAVTFRLTGS